VGAAATYAKISKFLVQKSGRPDPYPLYNLRATAMIILQFGRVGAMQGLVHILRRRLFILSSYAEVGGSSISKRMK
jgi:hypothetical protein